MKKDIQVKGKKMEGLKRVWLAMVMVGLMVPVEEAMGAQHVVGGSQGWDESTDFSSWASSQTFKVGDQLGELTFPHLSFFSPFLFHLS